MKLCNHHRRLGADHSTGALGTAKVSEQLLRWGPITCLSRVVGRDQSWSFGFAHGGFGSLAGFPEPAQGEGHGRSWRRRGRWA